MIETYSAPSAELLTIVPAQHSDLRGLNHRIKALDGWRGSSVLFVVACHIAMGTEIGEAARTVAGVLSIWAVTTFFVISGYIITKLAHDERQRTGQFSVRDFYIRRVFRIVPALYLYLISVWTLENVGVIKQSVAGLGASALFTCNMPGADCSWFVAHTWTLAYEEQFYLLFPLAFVIFAPLFPRLSIAAFACLACGPFVRYAIGAHGVWRTTLEMLPNFAALCCGIVLASNETAIERLVTGRASRTLSVAAGVFLAAVLVLVSRPATTGTALAYAQVALRDAPFPVCIAWLIAASVHSNGLLNRALASRPLGAVGAVSYSLYLWQQMFTGEALTHAGSPWFLPPLMLIPAITSYYVVERPGQRLGRLLTKTPVGRQESARGSSV